MSTELAPGEADDPYFIAVLNQIVLGLIRRNAPDEVWIIQIDNWFGHKWLKFSGIGSVDFPWTPRIQWGALEEFYQDKVTFPPFNPNRILSQWSFLRAGDHYVEGALLRLPHGIEKQASTANLLRRIEDFSNSACFVWYSGNTVANGRGSIMVYELSSDQVACWFASFIRQEEWKLQFTKGASRDDVAKLRCETT